MPDLDKTIYTITDAAFGDFEVKNTANAWWLDKTKVQHLIDAFKIDASIGEAKAYAGITERQWQYFNETHKNFCDIKEVCSQLPSLMARQTVVKDVKENPESARWYLKNKRNQEFSERVNNDIGTQQGFNIEISTYRPPQSKKAAKASAKKKGK